MPPIDDLPAPNRGASSIDDLPPPPGARGPDAGTSAIRGALSGVTAGFDDEITGMVGGAGRVAGIKNLGSWKPFDPDSHLEFDSPTLSPDEIVQAYRDNRDSIRAEQKQDIQTNPKATIAGNLAGAIISPVNKLKAAQKTFGPMTRGGTMLQAMKTSALQGAAYGAGASESDLTQGEVGDFLTDSAGGFAIGAAMPPALAGAGKVLKGGYQGATSGARKMFSGAFGVSEENVKKYLANPDRINGAKTLGEIKDLVDESVGRLKQAVDEGKIGESEAKDALRAMKEQVTRSLSDKKVDAKEALKAADDMFATARERALEPIKSVKAPTDRAADAAAMVGELKQQAIRASSDAVDALSGDKKTLDLGGVYRRVDDIVAGLARENTDEALAVAAKLKAYTDRIKASLGDKASEEDAKILIKGLDKVTEWKLGAGAFDDVYNAARKGIRGELDDVLKSGNDTYRKAMDEVVAPKFRALSKADEAFGKPEIGVGKLARLNTPRGEFDRKALEALEAEVGKKGAITREADQFANAQKILKDPNAIRLIERSLPEYEQLRRAMANVAKRNPKWTRAQIEQATQAERRRLAAAAGKRIFAERRFAPYSGMSPGSTENKIKSVMKGDKSSIENAKTFGRLSKDTGQDFLQMSDDLSVKESFEKPFHRGARNTVLWTVIGSVFGGVGAGSLAGANFGALVDAYGPRMAKKILDGVISVKNNPSVKALQSIDLPPNVKTELERELRAYMAMKPGFEERAASKVASNDRTDRKPAKGPDKWAADGAAKLGLDASAMKSPRVKQLLIEASDMKPGSPRLQAIKEQIKKEMGRK